MITRKGLPLLAFMVFLTYESHLDVFPPRRGLGGGFLTGPYIGPSETGGSTDGPTDGSTDGPTDGPTGDPLWTGLEGGAGIPFVISSIIVPPRRVFTILWFNKEKLFNRG